MAYDITKRRQIRAAEAKRDKLMENQRKNKQALAMVRAELKSLKSKR